MSASLLTVTVKSEHEQMIVLYCKNNNNVVLRTGMNPVIRALKLLTNHVYVP